jgi:ATP-dependent DNA helicase RecG
MAMIIIIGFVAITLPLYTRVLVPGFSEEQISQFLITTRLLMFQPLLLGVSSLISCFAQLKNEFIRAEQSAEQSFVIEKGADELASFTSRFPFALTEGQQKAIDTILADFKTGHPMSRLLEGDVGSGKTFIAAVASYITITNRPTGQSFGNLQVAYMAPTEVLATQLFENFIEYFQHTGISIALITGSGCRKFPSKNMQTRSVREAQYTGASNLCDGTRQCPHCAALAKQWTEISKSQLTKWIKNGEIPIVIGTHALIQKSVEFQDLGLVIIDEQHRFGTNQRMKLAKKEGHAPHYLSMTATPIPRTLALTIYGDLDISSGRAYGVWGLPSS